MIVKDGLCLCITTTKRKKKKKKNNNMCDTTHNPKSSGGHDNVSYLFRFPANNKQGYDVGVYYYNNEMKTYREDEKRACIELSKNERQKIIEARKKIIRSSGNVDPKIAKTAPHEGELLLFHSLSMCHKIFVLAHVLQYSMEFLHLDYKIKKGVLLGMNFYRNFIRDVHLRDKTIVSYIWHQLLRKNEQGELILDKVIFPEFESLKVKITDKHLPPKYFSCFNENGCFHWICECPGGITLRHVTEGVHRLKMEKYGENAEHYVGIYDWHRDHENKRLHLTYFFVYE
jgi:hypothetical protein